MRAKLFNPFILISMRSKSYLRLLGMRNRIPCLYPPVEDGEYIRQKIQEDITNDKGEVVRSYSVYRPKFVPLDESTKFHRGETAEMYSLDVLQKAGVELKRVQFSAQSLTLQDRSDYASYLDEVSMSSLEYVKPVVSTSSDTTQKVTTNE